MWLFNSKHEYSWGWLRPSQSLCGRVCTEYTVCVYDDICFVFYHHVKLLELLSYETMLYKSNLNVLSVGRWVSECQFINQLWVQLSLMQADRSEMSWKGHRTDFDDDVMFPKPTLHFLPPSGDDLRIEKSPKTSSGVNIV